MDILSGLSKMRIVNRSSLQVRFLLRVLLPPFLILIIISCVGYFVLSSAVRDGEIDNLKRASATTAAKFDREFALRKTVLRSTGGELFGLKSSYKDKRAKLDSDYKACMSFIRSSNRFTSAPNDVCRSFYAEFAVASQNGTSLQKALETGYTQAVKELSGLEQATVNERLRSFVEFFPETSQLFVVDKNGQIVSEASNGEQVTDEYTEQIEAIALKATQEAVEASYVGNGDVRHMVFAYPIEQGAVLASYDLDHSGFMYPSWRSAPIDNTRSYVIVADTKSKKSYPKIDDESLYSPVLNAEGNTEQTSFTSSNVSYLATSEKVGDTSWRVIVSSPAAIALESLANVQIIAVTIVGLLLISFLWVGSLFVRRTVDSILGLVGGALLFANNQLEHRIDIARMSDKEFSQLAEIMNMMAGKIQEAEAAIDQKNKEFISVATHEIKAPMTAVIGNLSMMLEDGMGRIDETARELADQAYKGTIRLRDLVNELLDIARLESGRAQFDLVQIDLASEIADMVKLQDTPAKEKGIAVIYEPPGVPLHVIADKTKLEIILTNFISNGIKYNRPQGQVRVSHQVRDGHVQITIQDTGLGIPADQQAKMFQKFFRVEGSDRLGIPGTGLGMYITKQFIEGMGGKLWFESEQGKGTAFHFTLPLAQNDGMVDPGQLNAAQVQGSGGVNPS